MTYYHLVFTLPHTLNRWVQLHPEVIYALVFHSVWATLKAFAADPRRLGGELGMTAVLHTWGQSLTQHVHLHCLIPGGALSPTGGWVRSKGNYLFPVRALSRVFRGKLVSALRRAYDSQQLPRVTCPDDVDTTLGELMRTDWVVYTRPCVSHTETVIAYLARYSHRIAVSDRRILGIEDNQVLWRYQDYRDRDTAKVMRLSGEEFVRRFLLHILPKGLMRLRHCGFLANRCRAQKLSQIRALLAQPGAPEPTPEDEADGRPCDGYPCPKCHRGRVRAIYALAPQRLSGH